MVMGLQKSLLLIAQVISVTTIITIYIKKFKKITPTSFKILRNDSNPQIFAKMITPSLRFMVNITNTMKCIF